MNKEKHVWIVDDDPIFQMIFKMMIDRTNQNAQIRQFSNGDLALKAAGAPDGTDDSIPCCIFLDINMPVKNGWDFLDELSSFATPLFLEQTRVYMVSSSINPADSSRALGYPVTKDFLIKPLTEEKIMEILESW